MKAVELERKIRDLAADIGSQEYFEKNGHHSKLQLYNYKHPSLDNLKRELNDIVIIRQNPPSFNSNTWWTFMTYIKSILPKDLIKLLYQYYVKAQYPPQYRSSNNYNSLYNLTIGLPWYDHKDLNRFMIQSNLKCIHENCNVKTNSVYFAISKLRYEEWLDLHMLTDHKISLQQYIEVKNKIDKGYKCLHIKQMKQEREINGCAEAVEISFETICTDCGCILSSYTDWL